MVSVTATWLGCSTFLLKLGECRVLLDAYLDRFDAPTGVASPADGIGDVDWILVGHSHFDHMLGADAVAHRTGATVVGSYETIRVMRELGVPGRQLMPVAGGERIALGGAVSVTVYPSLHSSTWAHTQDPSPRAECHGDLGVTYQGRRARARAAAQMAEPLGNDLRAYLQGAFARSSHGDGGPLVFLIDSPAGNLLFQDTAGLWSPMFRTLRPDVAILSGAGRGTLDGEPWQGSLAGFLAMEAMLLRPEKVLLCHHDDWLPGYSQGGDISAVRDAFARARVPSEVGELAHGSESLVFSDPGTGTSASDSAEPTV